jgi:hypothetical protein
MRIELTVGQIRLFQLVERRGRKPPHLFNTECGSLSVLKAPGVANFGHEPTHDVWTAIVVSGLAVGPMRSAEPVERYY